MNLAIGLIYFKALKEMNVLILLQWDLKMIGHGDHINLFMNTIIFQVWKKTKKLPSIKNDRLDFFISNKNATEIKSHRMEFVT